MGKKRKQRSPSKEITSTREKPLAQEKPVGNNTKKPSQKRRERPNWSLTALAGVGMALTTYLALTSWLGQSPLYCNEGSPCDIIQQSRWGTFFGIPIAFWGFLTYATLALIGFRVRHPVWHWKSAWMVSLVGLCYSIYLTAVSLFMIGSTCAYCIVSLLILAIIFGVIIHQRPQELPDFRYVVWAGKTIPMVLMFVGGMHLYYSGVLDTAESSEDSYLRELAEHLSQKKAVLYGASW